MSLFQEAVKYQTASFRLVNCGVCHIQFYLPQSKFDSCQEKGEGFHCPNGHSLLFTESAKAKMQKEIDQAKKRAQWAEENAREIQSRLDTERKSKAAIRGHANRVKDRISKGVCPCCNRTFQNLHRHMANQHKDFKADV